MRLGIEATNLRMGGGLTHLRELLRAAEPRAHGFSSVVVWAGRQTLEQLPASHDWLQLREHRSRTAGLVHRAWSQTVASTRQARHACDVLFVPGGEYAGGFHPLVTMSRSMLPFDARERARYGW